MAKGKRRAADKKPIEQYQHKGKQRPNNPPVGLVTSDTDKDAGRKKYAYDPHLDPQLHWAGKAEHTSFEIPTVSLHVHERIDPRSIIEAVRKKNGQNYEQLSLFSSGDENPPLREAIEFYKHRHNWSNRLIAGDSLLVMNSLLEKEGMASKVQMIYIDPPYGIKYGSNFQPFVNKRKVQDGKDNDLTQEPEMIKAFRDTWELGVHSWLTYLRDRLLCTRELLTESGSCFVQISDENLHFVRNLMDEVFGPNNFVALINFKTMMPLESGQIKSVFDYLCWYAKDKTQLKYRNLFIPKLVGQGSEFVFAETKSGGYRKLDDAEMENFEDTATKERIFKRSDLASSGYTPSCTFPIKFEERVFETSSGKSWRTTSEGVERLKHANRLFVLGKKLYYKMYLQDFEYASMVNSWHDTIEFAGRIFVVQTTETVIERAILMTTDPGDLVFDPTCGSGTTARVAEKRGRRWITCDTSRVAVALAKQRLMTGTYYYYELAHPEEGVGSGFVYKTVPHVTLKSIANNPDIKQGMSRSAIVEAIARHAEQETLYDQPVIDRGKLRVTGPFTVEAVPAPMVIALDDAGEQESGKKVTPKAKDVDVVYAGSTTLTQAITADFSIGRSGETLRQAEWRDELFRTGIRGKGGQKIEFTHVEPCAGTRWLHATAETKEAKPQLVAVSFGPEHAPLEQRQVELAIEEAQKLVPKPKMIVFATFQFDPEASRDIDETSWPGVVLLKAQMNADLLTEDLKKKRASNESFWLIGQPDVDLDEIKKGTNKGKYQVKVQGFDYYDTRSGTIESGGTEKIAMWMLDTDYDGRSLFPRQVFFPLADDKGGWAKLAKDLKAEIDVELIEAYRGTESLPFEPGKHKRVAVKIIDDRGIESLKVLRVD